MSPPPVNPLGDSLCDSGHTPASTTKVCWSGGPDALECIDGLRDALRVLGAASDQTAEQELTRIVSSSLDQIMEEHRGMADELIGVYEQLGTIFEVTRKLSTVEGESEVIGLFVENLRRSFAGRRVFAAFAAGDRGEARQGDWVAVGHGRGAPTSGSREQGERLEKRLASVLDRACRSVPAQTLVESLPPAESGTLGKEGVLPVSPRGTKGRSPDVLVGPVFSGGHLVCAIVIVRDDSGEGGPAAPSFHASDMRLVESLTTFCGDLIRSHRLVREMREMAIAMVRSLVSAVDQKDEYTSGHSLRVGYFASVLGRLLNLRADELQMLQWAALLHDVGKIGIRDDVLKKKGQLTPDETMHIQEHPTRSHQVVKQVPQLAAALDGVLCHHERFDGSGYPAGLKGDQIPLQARIVQIADVFDALTSSRSYRSAYDWREALQILSNEAGKTVDPELQRIFDRHMRAVLEADPEAWARTVQQANRFGSAFSDSPLAADPSAGAGVPESRLERKGGRA